MKCLEEVETHLHIRRGENARSTVVLPFKPVGIDLPVDVNDVPFLQRQLPEWGKKKLSDGKSGYKK